VSDDDIPYQITSIPQSIARKILRRQVITAQCSFPGQWLPFWPPFNAGFDTSLHRTEHVTLNHFFLVHAVKCHEIWCSPLFTSLSPRFAGSKYREFEMTSHDLPA
jgi:hypothetical protein